MGIKFDGTAVKDGYKVIGNMKRTDELKEGSIDVIRLNNAKGKLIKKAKDEWGISSPIEALAVDTEYNGKGYKAYLKLHSKSGIYRNGVIASE